MSQTLQLTEEDIERLNDGETVEFSHVVEGLKLSVSAVYEQESDT